MAGLAMLLLASVAPAQQPQPYTPPVYTDVTYKSATATPFARTPLNYIPPPPALTSGAMAPRSAAPALPGMPPAPIPISSFPTPYIQQAVYQQGPPGVASDEQGQDYQVQLIPPGPERVFRLESESSLFERMRQEIVQRPQKDRAEFPDEPILSKEKYAGRSWPEQKALVEPNYVCYGRLLFEDRNAERYGWDLGPTQPLLSTGLFFRDALFLPYNLFKDPCRTETSAGQCLPGDPVPYLLYPPELSVTGGVAEAAVLLTLFAVFP